MGAQFFNLATGPAVAGPALDAMRRWIVQCLVLRAVVALLALALFVAAVRGTVLGTFGLAKGIPLLIAVAVAANAVGLVVTMLQLSQLRREAKSTAAAADLWWKDLASGWLAGRYPLRNLAYLYAPGSNADPYWIVRPKAKVGDISSIPGTAALVFGGRRSRSWVLVVSERAAIVGTPISGEEATRVEQRVALGRRTTSKAWRATG
jgi:hypothetical protein